MKKKLRVLFSAMIVLLLVPAFGSAGFGRAGNMVSPADLVLVPDNLPTGRVWLFSGTYSWSYAPLFFRPDEREATEACGPGPTSPETDAMAEHLKLPGSTAYSMEWENGWSPDSVSVSMWSTDVFADPDRAEDYFLGTLDPAEQRVTLEAGRVYLFHAVWEREYPDEEFGEADYVAVTVPMTEEETAALKALEGAPFSAEDLLYLTVKIDGAECILGQTTPQELADRMETCFLDYDEMSEMWVITDKNNSGEVYLHSENDARDRPVYWVDAFWAYDLPVEYCGFDGVIADTASDPDNIWLPEEYRWSDEELREAFAESGGFTGGLWDGMIAWMQSEFHVSETPEGIYSAVITLSNGREVKISSHNSPVGLTLLR